MRGVAAIVVVIFHAILMFYPGIFYGPKSYNGQVVQNMRFEDNLYGNPLMGILTGSFSVAIFFVLSGFVLSIGFFKKGDVSVIRRLALKRYLRLMLPALAVILFAYVTIQLNLDVWREQVVAITHSSWLAGLWTQSPNLWEALKQGVYDAFVTGNVSYNPVLWTVRYELIGSFIIFGVALLFTNSKYRWIAYAALLLAFLGSWYLGFIIGMIMADLYVNGGKYLRVIPAWLLASGAIIGVGLGAFPPSDLTGTIFQWILIPSMTQLQNMSFYLTVAAALVIFATLLLPRLAGLFSHSRIAFMGKYTFALYLVHMPILFTIGAAAFVWMHGYAGLHMSAVLSTLVAFVFMIPTTYLFEKYIDSPSIKLSGILSEIYAGKREFRTESRKLWTYIILYCKVAKRRVISGLLVFDCAIARFKMTVIRNLVGEDSE